LGKMAKKAIFQSDISASDLAYINIRNADSPPARLARDFTKELWETYEPYADKNFLQEIGTAFHERFWEMYLTCTLLEIGLSAECPKPGPDVLIKLDNKKIWIEATAPTSGALHNPDRVPDYQFGAAYEVPEEKLILRIRNAIQEKYQTKYFEYRKDILKEDDVYMVAINCWQLPNAKSDRFPPIITRAVFPIGPLQVFLDKKTGDVVDTKYAYRPSIVRSSGTEIKTDIFLDTKFKYLSSVLYSCIDAGNPTKQLGDDFIVVHNPLAINPMPHKLLGRGREYVVVPDGKDQYLLKDLMTA
jgi:hypothetical protein